MMRIEIEYDSCWRNSFLSGSNNKPISKKENIREYIASTSSLNEENFKECKINQDTIMGILNRLIGDQRKLYQSRASENYYFKDLENKVEYDDNIEVNIQEVVYLRNKNLVTDQKSFSGVISTHSDLFNGDYAKDLWKIIFCKFDDIIKCIVKQDYQDVKSLEYADLHPIKITSQLESLTKDQIVLDDINNNLDDFKKSLKLITDFQIERGTDFYQFWFYAYALYQQIERLKIQGIKVDTDDKDKISGVEINSFYDKKFKYESDHPIFNSSYTQGLWKIIFCEFDDLVNFILDKNYPIKDQLGIVDLASIKSRLNELKSNKFKIDKSDINDITKEALNIVRAKYCGVKEILPKKYTFYIFALDNQIQQLKEKGIKVFTEKKGNISGISANSFTLRDFAKYFAKVKYIYGNPYKFGDKSLTKATGSLEIKLDISDDKANDLAQKILNSGVSPFYLGKKGLAYVKDIRVNGTSIY